MRDTGGGFGQKVVPLREDMCLMLAARKVPAALKWIEDRRENLMSAGQARHEHGTVRMAFDEDARILAMQIDHVQDVGAYPTPWPVDRRGRRRHALPRAVPGATGDVLDEVGLHEHQRPHRVSRAVAVRVARRGGRSRHRGAPDGHRPGRAPSSQPAPPGRAAVHQRERHAVRPHLAVGDLRAGAGDARLRGVPAGAGRARALPAVTSGSAPAPTSSRRRPRQGYYAHRGRDDPHRAVGHA